MTKPRVLILHAPGSNRDREAALACELAGGQAEIVHINALTADPARLDRYQMMVLPGGFSFGDDLGAGKIWALSLRYRLTDALTRFHQARKPILGICNGFQALVKTGFLPGNAELVQQTATLTRNASSHFECRWVTLQTRPNSPCVFTRGLDALIDCPVAHGEGRFELGNSLTPAVLAAHIALTYVREDGSPASGAYPRNPNGSVSDIAGICDATGTILGLMPHPEDHVFTAQHPRVARGFVGRLGLPLFTNGIQYAKEC